MRLRGSKKSFLGLDFELLPVSNDFGPDVDLACMGVARTNGKTQKLQILQRLSVPEDSSFLQSKSSIVSEIGCKPRDRNTCADGIHQAAPNGCI